MRAVFGNALGKTLGGARPDPSPEEGAAKSGRAFLTFANTGEVIRAEATLKKAGFAVSVMGPPPSLRTGCDMVLVFPLLHGYAAVQLLEKEGIAPLRLVPAGEAMLDPVSLYAVKDYGQWLMVRAANMKLTVRKVDGRIVNVSGGGCPDVPYLAAVLANTPVLKAAPLLKEHGHTLCGYALDLALAELLRLLQNPGAMKEAAP